MAAPKRILITGAGGFLGRHIVNDLSKGGHDIRAIVRAGASKTAWPSPVQTINADLTSDDLSAACSDIDVVIHAATTPPGRSATITAANISATERLLTAMKRSNCRRIVHISSISVYDWSKSTTALNEDSPLLAENAGSEYAKTKLAQESVIRRYAARDGFDVTVLRAGFLWGPGRISLAGTGRTFGQFHLAIEPRRSLPLCYVANCSNAVTQAAINSASSGGTFNVIDTADISVSQFLGDIDRAKGTAKAIIPISHRFGRALAAAVTASAKLLSVARIPSIFNVSEFDAQFKPLTFSNTRIKSAIGWAPPLTYQQCLQLIAHTPEPPHTASHGG